MRKTILASCIILALSSISGWAAKSQPYETPSDEFEDEFSDENMDFYGGVEFVSIATGTKKAIDKAPAIASVITAEDIERIGATNLTEALALVPGLHISRNSQMMAPKFSLRGITSTYVPQTLFMIDGIPTTSIVRGDNHTVWGMYPVNSISRIEIIRGPGSALYGADAFAGVINVITKSAGSPNKTGLNIGSFGTYGAFISAGYEKSDLALQFNLDYQESDGHSEKIIQDAQFPLDQLASQIVGLPPVSLAPGPVNVGYQLAEAIAKVDYKGFSAKVHLQQRRDVGTGQGVTEALDPSARLGSDKIILEAAYNAKSDNGEWQYNIRGSVYESDQQIIEDVTLFPAGTFFGAFPDGIIGNPSWSERTSNLEFKADYSGNQKHFVSLGIGYSDEDLYEVRESKNFFADLTLRPEGVVDVSDTAEVFMPEANRSKNFIYIQDIWQVAPDWELTSGLRYDKYSDFGSTINPRLALVWSKSLKSTVKFLYGKAFRAPSFAELLTVNNPVSLGNTNLEPEKIETLEGAYVYKHDDKHTFSINVFYYQVDDFITFIPDSTAPTSTAQNVGERTGWGLELESKLSLADNIEATANYSYVKAKDDVLDDDVGEYPNHQLKGDLNWSLSNAIALNITARIVGERERTPLDTRENLDQYQDIWLSLKYKPVETNWNAQLSIKNLFNDDIREPSLGPSTLGGAVNIPFDLPQAGRSITLKISLEI